MIYEILKYDIVDDEIEDVILYYENNSYQLGLKVENALEETLDNLERNPEHYFNLEDNIHRRITIEGFPYAFIYSILDNYVIVKMLFPQLEDPAKLWLRIGRFS